MNSTSPAPTAHQTGFLFPEPAFYQLRQLREQLKLMGYLSAACAGDETREPTMAIHRWYAGFEALEQQVGHILSRARWVSLQQKKSGNKGKKLKRAKAKGDQP